MSRKTASDKTNLTPITANEEKTGQEPENGQEVNAQDDLNAIENEFGDVLLSGKGKKLSPKSDSFVYFDLVTQNSDNQLHIRLTGNDGGGLHSKEHIPIQSILDVLEKLDDKPFKSAVFGSVFRGLSANNKSFMAAAMRSETIGLILPSPNSAFLHVLAPDFKERRDKLLTLVNPESTSKTKS